MPKDFDRLQLFLAEARGARSVSALPANQREEHKAWINEAYQECFLPPDGRLFPWSLAYAALPFAAPLDFTFAATSGSTAIASPSASLAEFHAGAMVRIGSEWFTYAGANAMLEPWGGDTGTVTARIFAAAVPLPARFIKVIEEPEIVGWGRLMPMSGRSQEIRYRSLFSRDFIPEDGAGFRSGLRLQLESEPATGEPIYYFIDDAAIGASIAPRFCIYPLPDRRVTARLRSSMLPQPLDTGTDVPALPEAVIDTILLPLARAKLAEGARDYPGEPEGPLQAGMAARAKLDAMATRQKSAPARMKLT
jgi:hypothetical protein